MKYLVKKYNLAEQYAGITSKFNGNILESKINHKHFQIKMKVKPTSYSRDYVLLLQYKKNQPKVWLCNIENNGHINEFPHIYKADKKNNRILLCLYFGKAKEWNNSMLISDTIIPWAIEWLFHFEIWLATNHWNGGGIEHR